MNMPPQSRSGALTPPGEASVLDLLERLKKELGATPRDLGTRIVNALLIVDAAIIKVNSDPDRIAAICELDGCYALRVDTPRIEQVAWLKGLLASGAPFTHREEDRKVAQSIIAALSENLARQPIRGVGIEGGYVIVTPVGKGHEPAQRLREQILELFPVEKRT